ncbi:F-type H+-transporting ATPase subunit delta [Azomonas agilis]|uniref:ATP synthase subunit delta n=1 Tax=Azomonas agilis TaxID=116849 RepID=A0A562HZS8_9GAMM|nr:F0F1 ATP synthase subunit delta [Azomonas agilis]TWH64271.1 F-type H+-transporting ATPase subunit delta [Azomonas agilis]
MINNQPLARPYAKAAFELATQTGQIDVWFALLSQAASIVKNPEMAELIGNPKLTQATKVEALISLLGDTDKAFCNFVATLGENDRLEVIPTIFETFEALKLEAEKSITVEVETAYELSEEQLQTLAASLSKRLDRTVNLQQEVNPALIGGLVIRAGDVVIDGSVRGKLSQLAEALKS